MVQPFWSAQAWITQLLTCKEHHACLYLVSVHQVAPPLNVVGNKEIRYRVSNFFGGEHLIAAQYSVIDPGRMKGTEYTEIIYNTKVIDLPTSPT